MLRRQLEEAGGEDSIALAEVKSRLIEDHMVARTLYAHAHAELGSAGGEFFQA
jgi:hypothetical protein